jgi:hypothetical protein
MPNIPTSIKEHEVRVEMIDDQPDELGRTMFFLYWYDPCTQTEGGPPNHVRGQVFHSVLSDHLDRFKAEKFRVFDIVGNRL